MNFLLINLLVIPAVFCGFEKNEPLQFYSNAIASSLVAGYPTNYTGCGGVIPISTLTRTYISYKRGQVLDLYDSCVWILAPNDNVTSVRVTLYEYETINYEGITAFATTATGYTYFVPPTNSSGRTSYNFNTPLAILVLSGSTGTFAHKLKGFYMNVQSTGRFGTRSTQAFHTRKGEGEFSYPMIGEDTMKNSHKGMALVLQKSASGRLASHLSVKLRNVNIGERDSIQAYMLTSYYFVNDFFSLGNYTTDAEFEVNSNNPVLIILRSQDTLRGKSFQVEWNEYPYTIQ